MLLSATMVLVIVGVFMIGSILTSDKEPSGVLDDGLPLKYAHKGDDWDTGGLFWDAKYGQERTKTLQAEDLVLRDLGYHDSGDLENIAQCKSYYISRIRWNTQVYQKEEDGNWILLNIESLTKNLDEGETLELPEVYIGFKHKHRTRLILYRLKQNEWGNV